MEQHKLEQQLQNKCYAGSITNIDALEKICAQHDLDAYEDILSPIGWNSCDKCGEQLNRLGSHICYLWAPRYAKCK